CTPSGLFLLHARRPGVLRGRSHGGVPPIGRLRRSHFARRETRRSAVPAADQIRADDQPHSRQSARPRIVARAASACRRGDRVSSRREFITLLGGAAAAWPVGARAQQRTVPTIGVLVLGNPDPEPFLKMFREGLQQLGYIEGQNIRLEFRSAGGKESLLADVAGEL